MYELESQNKDVVFNNRDKAGRKHSVGHMAKRMFYPLRHLTSDAIAGQALGGIGGTLAGAGTGALLLGLSANILSRNRRFRAFSISLGAVLGASMGSTLGGVSGAATGLFFGLARLPFAILRSFRVDDPTTLITPIEKTVKGGWQLLNDPVAAKLMMKEKYATYLPYKT